MLFLYVNEGKQNKKKDYFMLKAFAKGLLNANWTAIQNFRSGSEILWISHSHLFGNVEITARFFSKHTLLK